LVSIFYGANIELVGAIWAPWRIGGASPLAQLRISSKPFAQDYLTNTKGLTKLAKSLRVTLTSDGVHDLRVSARRVQTMIRLLPKQTRGSAPYRKLDLTLRSLLRSTSKLRDSDILLKTLDPYRKLLSPKTISSLERTNREAETVAGAAIKRFSGVTIPVMDKSGIDGKKLSKRLRRRIRKRSAGVGGLLRKVVRNESRVRELHLLRLEVKKLRYQLELVDEKPKELPILSKWQDNLGVIHDIDVAIAFVQDHPRATSAQVLNELRRVRHMEYGRFLNQLNADFARDLKDSEILVMKSFSAPSFAQGSGTAKTTSAGP
jgi:CHAD domain-containing protein